MIELSAETIASLAGGHLMGQPTPGRGPEGVSLDSRDVCQNDLFVGLRGRHWDGGRFAQAAIGSGAWGALVGSDWERESAAASAPVIVVDDPLAALRRLAEVRRAQLRGCVVAGVTGSAGKTSTKDILLALVSGHRRAHGTRGTANDVSGVAATLVSAPPDAELLIVEMGTRGRGQIADLAHLARPGAGLIVNVGAAHLGPLRSVGNVAAAKAELIESLAPGSPCVVPAHAPWLVPHLRTDLKNITFGPGGDVRLTGKRGPAAEIFVRGEKLTLDVLFDERWQLANMIAAVAMATALGVTPAGSIARPLNPLRGEILHPAPGVVLVNDCFNANPVSLEAALTDLALADARRRVAVLGRMADLGRQSTSLHRYIGERAAVHGVELLITVGRETRNYCVGFKGPSVSLSSAEAAAAYLHREARPGDRILVKGSRVARLERVAKAWLSARPRPSRELPAAESTRRSA